MFLTLTLIFAMEAEKHLWYVIAIVPFCLYVIILRDKNVWTFETSVKQFVLTTSDASRRVKFVVYAAPQSVNNVFRFQPRYKFLWCVIFSVNSHFQILIVFCFFIGTVARDTYLFLILLLHKKESSNIKHL